MEGNRYFQKALADFTKEAANGGAIRHLADLGYTVKEIAGQLDFPSSYEKVRLAVWGHLIDSGAILRREPGSCAEWEKAAYIKEYDRFGKPTFRRVVERREASVPVSWNEKIFSALRGAEAERLLAVLKEELDENGREDSYMSCDFGLTAEREPAGYETMLGFLERREREYVSGLPWEARRVYHRLKEPMEAVLTQLCLAGQYRGECYFLKTGCRIKIGEAAPL